MTDLVAGGVGTEVKYDLAFKEGKLCAEVDYVGKQLTGGIVLKLDADAIIDAIKVAIPGHFDDMVLEAAKSLLKGA